MTPRPEAERPEAARSLRPLGLPRPLRVRTDGRGEPAELTPSGGRQTPRRTLTVERVEEVWRIAEEWWRPSPDGEGLARTYYRVMVKGGRSLTVFQDARDGRWYEQRY